MKNIPFNQKEGFIIVKLYDRDYNLIYETKVMVRDEKDTKRMLKELKGKGMKINLDDDWF